MDKVRLGIIGIGNMGSTHLNNIFAGKCPEITVSAVFDTNPARLEWACSAHKKVKETNPDLPDMVCFDDGAKLMQSGLVDAVIVAVPHYQHPRYVIEALKNNLHVISEKPAGVYTSQVKEMIAEADKHPDLVFGMMFNQRTNCVFRKLKEIIDSGELGAIRRTCWIITNWYRSQCYYDSGSWRATWSGEGGGVLLNQCPHNLDLWQWICGMPIKISAKMSFGKWHDIEVEDDVTAYAEYANGATGTFITSTGDAPGTNRLEIDCDGGKIICDNAETLTMYKLDMPEPEFTKVNKTIFGQPKVTKTIIPTDGDNPQHIGVLNAFAGAILRGTPLIADGREGINGLSISNAMHLSCWQNRDISLPLSDEDERQFNKELSRRIATSKHKADINSVIADTNGSYNS